MTDNAATLRHLLVGQYGELKKLLARRLGSEELASEALQETYLRLERPIQLGPLASPKQYLLTIATNIARMGFRRARRWTDLSELDRLVGFVDDTPGPHQGLEARQGIEALEQAFAELTPRRRQIIYAARVEGIQLADIAAQLGVSKRLVEKELRAALLSCASKLDREVVPRFGSLASRASKQQGDAGGDQDDGDDNA